MTSVPIVLNLRSNFSLSSRRMIGQLDAAANGAQSAKRAPTFTRRMRCSVTADTRGERRKSKPKPAQNAGLHKIDDLLDRSSRESEDEFSWAARATTRAIGMAQSQGRSPHVPLKPRKLASRSPPALEPWEQPLKAAIVPVEKVKLN